SRDGKHSTVAEAWREQPLRAAVYVTALIMMANFLAFTYIAPFLLQIGASRRHGSAACCWPMVLQVLSAISASGRSWHAAIGQRYWSR
ncbi:hypothetical protein NL425_26640, partial [Klebsiella pneumoniae]|nr:hypothetical protein [Klebsiella pneumoniae]